MLHFSIAQAAQHLRIRQLACRGVIRLRGEHSCMWGPSSTAP
jgi:hypothetical protein